MKCYNFFCLSGCSSCVGCQRGSTRPWGMLTYKMSRWIICWYIFSRQNDVMFCLYILLCCWGCCCDIDDVVFFVLVESPPSVIFQRMLDQEDLVMTEVRRSANRSYSLVDKEMNNDQISNNKKQSLWDMRSCWRCDGPERARGCWDKVVIEMVPHPKIQ